MSEATVRSASRRRTRLLLFAIAALGLPAAAAVVYTFPPGEAWFYPPCWWYTLTGLHCPGCGATRCVYALLHGDLVQALAYNSLLVAALPLLLVCAVQCMWSQWTGRRLPLPRMPAWSIHAIMWTILAFGILRNIPIAPLTLLAPHKL
jgi:hypothetical protein